MSRSQLKHPTPPPNSKSQLPPSETEVRRYDRMRIAILDAATELINSNGVRGMTLVDAAEMVGLSTSSVTYYYRTKDQLAHAAFEATLERIEWIVTEAGREATPRARVAAYVRLYFETLTAIWRGEARPIAVLSDMRALSEPVREPLAKHYSSIFRGIRLFFGPPHNEAHRAVQTARAQVLTESIYWLPAWLKTYSYADFGRVQDRLLDLFDRGLAPDDQIWPSAPAPLHWEIGIEKGKANFLRVAARLISERGYRGASVERIVAEMSVTKGSFYHHLEGKDDLVLECFRYSYKVIGSAQRAADMAGGSQWHRLSSTIAALLNIQLAGEWPLLRTTALQALPQDVRDNVVARSDRVALHFAGTIIDGISEGTIRPVDPIIASQTIMASLNAAFELHNWAAAVGDRERAVLLYASTLAYGLFDDRIL